MSRYLLVDGNALAHRLWWASQHDVPARFKSTLERVAAGQKAALHAVAWDTPGSNWRRDLWNGYKAGRKPKPALLTAALEACRRTRLPHVAAPGFEADDILGTLADYFVSEGHEVAILTHDKDLAQLVSACCWIVDERGKEMREAQVRARFGVDPCHVRHWAASPASARFLLDVVDGLELGAAFHGGPARREADRPAQRGNGMSRDEARSADPKAPEPGRYRKRPVVVEAVRFDPERFEALKAAGYPLRTEWRGRAPEPSFVLWTAKSSAYCAIATGEYILHEPDGKGFYPCTAAAFATTYEAVDGAEAVNAEPPATPEPAAPKPRVSDDLLSRLLDSGACTAAIWTSTTGDTRFEDVMFDLRDGRAKVAELEARIADIHEALGENAGSDDASLPASIRWTLADHRNALEESEAALARANEALGNIHRKAYDALPGAPGARHRNALEEIMRMASAAGWDIAAAGAQGSAAQKPEGP